MFKGIDGEFERLIDEICDTGFITNVEKIRRAYNVAKEYHGTTCRRSGELYLYHPLAVVKKMFMDGFIEPDILAAAMLHDTVEDTTYTLDDVARDFGPDIKEYVNAVTKFTESSDPLAGNTKATAQQITDEHMIEVGRQYPFAFYIKLADRWHNLHTCSVMSVESINRNVAHTRNVLVPLARKLGCNKMAEELLDACLLAKHKKEFSNLTNLQNNFVRTAKRNIDKTIVSMQKALEGKAIVHNKFKPTLPYRIKKDIKRKHPNANFTRTDLFSIYGYTPYVTLFVELINPTSEPYYMQFNSLYRNILKEKGIIASIKNEQTLDYDIESVKIEYVDVLDNAHNVIRIALVGKGQYWKYKNAIAQHPNMPHTTSELLPYDKKLTVYTRKGDPREIPKGATVLDFAFILNTGIGSTYQTALVNGQEVPIDYVLQPRDSVTIIKADQQTARMDWFLVLTTMTAKNRLLSVLSTS